MKALILSLSLTFFCLASSAQWVDNNRPSNPSGDVYANGEALSAGQSYGGVILDVRRVKLEPDSGKKMAGTTMGATLGGLAGVRSTGSLDAKIAGATIGGIVGGWIGGVATTQLASQNALEVIVQTADGRAVVVVQTVAEADNLSIGQKVFVVNVRGNTRVVRASI